MEENTSGTDVSVFRAAQFSVVLQIRITYLEVALREFFFKRVAAFFVYAEQHRSAAWTVPVVSDCLEHSYLYSSAFSKLPTSPPETWDIMFSFKSLFFSIC